jgi:beta-galactosidase
MVTHDQYLFGAHVYREPVHSLDSVRHDMTVMRDLGMNIANLQISWAWCNPSSEQYDFDELDTLIEEADRLGLGVAISPTMCQVPAWIWAEHPEARPVNALGQPIIDPTQYVMPADGKPGPCWDYAPVRELAEQFLSRLVQHVSRFENLVYWDVWQEIGLGMVWPDASPAEKNIPFNPETLVRFREYLRDRYGTLDELNRVWGVRYTNWDHVEPPRLYEKVPSYTDWRRFQHEVYLRDAVRFHAQAVRSSDRHRLPVMAHVGHPLWGSTVEFVWSREVDWYGTSFYPTAALYWGWERSESNLDPVDDRYHELWASLFQLDFARCTTQPDCGGSGGRFVLGEMACGPYNMGLEVNGVVTHADLRRWLLLQLCAGVQSVIVWNTRPEHFWDEAQGQGFLDGRGGLTERSEALREYGNAVTQYGDLFLHSVKPASPVAIALDEDHCRVSDGLADDMSVYMPLRGTFEALFRVGVEPDFVDLNRIDDDLLDERRLLILPFPYAMSDETLRKIRRYAEQGGTVLCGPTPARFDEHGWAPPTGMSPVAEELFGVRQKSLRHVAEINAPRRLTPDERRAGDILPATRLVGTDEFSGLHPKASYYLQSYEVSADATPTLLHGEDVFGVVRRIGKGRIYLIGTVFAYSTLAERCDGMRSVLDRVLSRADIWVDHDQPVYRSRRVMSSRSDDTEMWTLINRSPEVSEWSMPDIGAHNAVDVLTGEQFSTDDSVSVLGHDLRTIVIRK